MRITLVSPIILRTDAATASLIKLKKTCDFIRGESWTMTLTIPKHLETERLILRKYTLDDAKWYHSMSVRNKSHLERYESENPVMDIQSKVDAKELMLEFDEYWKQGNHFLMGAFLIDSNDFVAQIYIGIVDKKTPELAIGYFADVDNEGNGYVTEAVNEMVRVLFKVVGVHRVRCECDDTNTRSIRVAERCGFVKEAHFRKNKMNPDGTYSGTFIYGMLRDDITASGD
ncbi:MAG: GNAT family protein [Candidatus Thorarchaeota archaeon]